MRNEDERRRFRFNLSSDRRGSLHLRKINLVRMLRRRSELSLNDFESGEIGRSCFAQVAA